jgi:cytochrome c553
MLRSLLWATAILGFACEAALAVDFDREVRPIFASRCFKCHGASHPEAELNLTDRDSTFASGAIVASDASVSSVMERITASDVETRMPPEGEPLSEAQIETLRSWISEGAEWPDHWAYRALAKPELPTIADAKLHAWARTPIDVFIAAELERRGLSPSPEVEETILKRRLSFDLLGLPDASREESYEKLVDRWLASPHLGERMARGWMDVVHFAETHGHDQDRPREHSWPYRDYLIESFNADKPYGRFVAEQVAGDVLYPNDAQAIVATGLLAAGPWDESSLRDIREDSIDSEIGRYLDRDDIVSTVMQTFASASVHCARCHDHKFDPISQDEYYSLQAVFAGVDKANREYDADPMIAARRGELQQAKQSIVDQLTAKDAALLSPERLEAVAQWEAKTRSTHVIWTPLEEVRVESENGTQFEKQTDGSVLATGERPEVDVYTVTGATKLKRVSALRIDLLTDDSLPQKGPGRQENGNLHLNEITVSQSLAPPGVASASVVERPMSLTDPRADFNQMDWGVEKAIDGNEDSAWGIHPQVGKPHHATFSFATPVSLSENNEAKSAAFTISLRQTHGRAHTIGRFRISLTDAELPLPPDEATLPANIAAILANASDERTVDQQLELSAYVHAADLEAQLASLPAPSLVYSGTPKFKPDGSFKPAGEPRQVQVLGRGLITDPLREATPGALSCLKHVAIEFPEASSSDGQRRAAIAKWLSDPNNGLVWRSIANRLWQHHFGRGLVETANDFGLMGSAPSHPELLEWLAVTLVESGGSLKELHRLIVTSSVYRQTSQHRDGPAAIDGDNRLLWRMNRRRLDAESFRDALLVKSQTLDAKMGGPSVKQFIETKGVHVTPEVDYLNFDAADKANYRRSVYRFIFRTLPDPLMDALDCPDASQLTPQRTESLTALQALATLNDKFVIQQSEHLGELVEASSEDDRQRALVAFETILNRLPTENESAAVAAYADRHGWANACRFLVNSNEFLFVE